MKDRFNTTLDRELLKQLKIKAINEGKNVNDILEELIKEYFEREESKQNGGK